MQPNRALGIGFDDAAEVYHDAWPPYPTALFDRIVESAGLRPSARILDIGCGTARATLPFAERGFSIIGLEPGSRLAAESRERLAAFPLASVEETTFEAWPLPDERFDAVVSAQAFHWVDPAIAIPKVVEALKPRGALGFFWRRTILVSPTLVDAVQRVHDEFELALQLRGGPLAVAGPVKNEIESSSAFEDVAVFEFSEPVTYDAPRYLRHLSVYPGYVALAGDTRREALSRVARVLDDAGGVVPLEIATVLYVAQKKRRAATWARALPLPLRKLGNRLLGR